jgi:Methyltransferase domain
MTDQHSAPPVAEPQALREQRPSRPAQHEFTANRLNRLAEALDARSYLEIGVETGVTFDRVRVAERTGVDPAFLFDITSRADETTVLAQTTSDEFFAELPPDRQYDLIFIDGLHTFEQAYRDLCNCLLHSHQRTAMLLDDTLPSDVYSALRSPEQALAFRAAAGVDSSAWHGDAFKVVFAIHDFHLGLDYRTIVGSGNPQTLVWRSNAGRRRPLLDSLETISRMTYFDMVNQVQTMRQSAEELAIRKCVMALNGAPSPAPA